VNSEDRLHANAKLPFPQKTVCLTNQFCPLQETLTQYPLYLPALFL
jgi:hypothetical protein